jgi:predicted ATP-grasp superfamily ATP-dependent carboligase
MTISRPPDPCEQHCSRRRLLIYMAKDVWVSAQMARGGELRPRAFLSHYLRRHKVRAVFAADDPLPALASLGYLRSRI